tara:strand:+ start:124 stop:351 length:228 start_codon:yes stop_codon:yes gene_type:complete
MTLFSEWQQLSQTKVFIERLKQSIAKVQEESTSDDNGKFTVEQIGVAAIERKAEVRTFNAILEELTSKEVDDEQT